MAPLTDADRKEQWAKFMSRISHDLEIVALNKFDIKAAVDAIDTWLDSNANSLNTALPQPARGVLTTKQKAEILVFVVEARYLRS